ncbi:hypothetical protein B4081_2078 [Bacillus cereus]|nr:hypothetical protein B4081_2078 [Bacillus cereus]
MSYQNFAEQLLFPKALFQMQSHHIQGVTAWEEVQEDELPKKVKEKLGVK